MEAAELEAAAGVAADDEDGAAPKLNGDGAPDGAVKKPPKLPEFAVNRVKENLSTLKLYISQTARDRG